MHAQGKPRRGGRFFLILFACLGISVFLFRHDLLLFGLNLFVKKQTSHYFGEPLTYDRIEWEEGKVVARGVRLADEHFHLAIDSVVLDWSWSWYRFYFQPRLLVQHPELTMVRQRDQGALPFLLAPLVPQRFCGIKVDVHNGVLQLDSQAGEQRLYFAFQSGLEREALGTLYLSYDPHLYALPTTELGFRMEGEEVFAYLKVAEMESARLLPLLSFFCPLLGEGWKNSAGSIEIMAEGGFSSDGTLSYLSGSLNASDFHLSNARLGVRTQAKSLQGAFRLPPQEERIRKGVFWEEVEASAVIEGGEWMLSRGGVRGVEGQLVLAPGSESIVALHGVWVHEQREVPLQVEGGGSVHEDQRFWLDLALSVRPESEAPSDAVISLCSPEEESCVVQVELKQFDLRMLEPFGLVPSHTRGRLEGCMVGWVYDRKLAKLRFDEVVATRVRWDLPGLEMALLAEQMRAEALFTRTIDGDWRTIALHGEVPEVVVEKGHHSSLYHLVFSGEDTLLSFNITRGQEAVEVRFDFAREEGWLKSEALDAASLAPWIEGRVPGLSLAGEIELFANFNREEILCSMQGSNWKLSHPRGALLIAEVTHPLLLTCSFSGNTQKGFWGNDWMGSCEGNWRLENGVLFDPTGERIAESVCADCHWERGLLTLSELAALSKGIGLAGSLTFDSAASQLTFSTLHAEGPLESLAELAGWDTPLKGRFVSHEEGFSLVARGEEVEWRFAAELSEMTMPLKGDLLLDSGSCHVEYDAKGDTLALSQIEAALVYGDRAYHLAGRATRALWWEFDAALSESGQELAHAAGVAELCPPGEVHFAFEKNRTHLLGTKLEISRCVVKAWTELLSLEMRPLLTGDQLSTQLAYLDRSGIFPNALSTLGLAGEIETFIAVGGGVTFALRSPLLSIGEQLFSDCYLRGVWEEEGLRIEGFKAGGYSGEALFIPHAKRWECVSLGVATENASLALHGEYLVAEQLFNAQLDLLHFAPSSALVDVRGEMSYALSRGLMEGEFQLSCEVDRYLAESRTPFRASYQASQGLVVEGVDLLVIDAEKEEAAASLFAGRCSYDGTRWLGQKVCYALEEDALSSYPSLQSEWIPETGDGEVEFFPERNLLKAGFKAALRDTPLFWRLQLDRGGDQLLGSVTIADAANASGIKGLFSSQLDWKSIKGSAFGVTLDLKRGASGALAGTVACDPSKAALLLTEEKRARINRLNLGDGYLLEGAWDLSKGAFEGALRGEAFVLGGYLFEQLSAEIQWDRQGCLVENLKLSDPALNATIKRANFTRGASGWSCHAPLISVEEFQPSRLRSSAGKASTLRPFTIRKASFFDLEGELDDLNSFKGQGTLHFTNALKKESSLLDLPLEMIKKLGLDLALFTPVYGEVTFCLSEGKFVITALANAHSEGRRSEFFLPGGERAFIDLEGNLHFDLRMKQNVVLNITEPFTLTVRGSVSNPKYQLVR